jgi:hypothetical protein
MAKFITRVELHKATREDCDRLHTAMEKRAFSRTITAANGTDYDLPMAEYDRIGSKLTRNQAIFYEIRGFESHLFRSSWT